ncbi:MAG: tRNA (cytidine(56)-2'-O)-methyltransferase [Candidatus Hodarchaeota archaeon]
MLAVLRLGHRPGRDRRVTTHVALTARAFGANKIFVATKDKSLINSINKLVNRFGGDFSIEDGIDWKKMIRNWPGSIVHLTMYGLPIDDILDKIPRNDLLIVVGAEKVPKEIFNLVHFNVAIGHQPHSEVAALAVFLDRYLEGKGISLNFDGEITVIPSKYGKKIIDSSKTKYPRR